MSSRDPRPRRCRLSSRGSSSPDPLHHPSSLLQYDRRQTHALPLPADVRRGRFCGSFDGGWPVLAHSGQPHRHVLYNLNSEQRIVLPRGISIGSETRLRPVTVRAATVCASRAPDAYLVAARASVAFWNDFMPHWTAVGSPVRDKSLGDLHDVIYYNGGFHFVPELSPGGQLVAMDRTDYKVQERDDCAGDVQLLKGVGSMTRYLVVESRGELLMVVRYVYDPDATEVLRVFRFTVDVEAPPVDDVDQRPRASWVDVGRQLDGRMLFLGRGCSRSFEVAQFDRFQHSMIYFLYDRFDRADLGAASEGWFFLTDMGRFSMPEMGVLIWPPEDQGIPAVSDRSPPIWWLH